MNNVYRIIWNKTLAKWVVASELAKQGKKSNSVRRCAVTASLLLNTITAYALPTGDQLVSGSASVTTPSAGHMQINQASQNAIINWQGFSVGQHEAVNIQQPNSNAALLNRVVGQDPSSIQGQISSNGQVFLVNPNGVLFSKTAQVDVGGLVASTRAINNQDFLNGKLHFTQDNAQGGVVNQGHINTSVGGVVALIGEQVENSGSINTPQGSTALAAGKTVDLDMQGNGLVEVKVTEAALKAQINNSGIIQADGGQVLMTAQAAGQLLNTVINNQGIIEARGLTEKNGSIVLSGGDTGIVQVSGTLDVSGQTANTNAVSSSNSTLQGGTITVSGAQIQLNNGAHLNASGDAGGGSISIGDKQSTQQATIDAGANLDAQTLDHGKAGSIAVFANLDNGAVTIAGQLNASAPKQGDGGAIETSASSVKVADTAQISTEAANGKTGNWLIDPTDFTIASSGGDMSGTALSNALINTNMQISSNINGHPGNGDINVNDPVTWSANLLTLTADRNININANLNGSGRAELFLQYGQANLGGDYFINNGAAVNLPGGQSFSIQSGSGTVSNPTPKILFTVFDSTNAVGLFLLNANASSLAGNYALGSNFDVTGIPNIIPIGGITPFSGAFHGLGHTISNLSITDSVDSYAGLFGYSTGVIRDIGLLNTNILLNANIATTGASDVGGLVGYNAGTVSNAYVTGAVKGTVAYQSVGGLVGFNLGTVNNAYTTATVVGTGANDTVGGLVGSNGSEGTGAISNAYATGTVTGTGASDVGGLVGYNGYGSTISNSYATGSLTGVTNPYNYLYVGGLVGLNSGSIINSFWDKNATGQSVGIGQDNGTVSGVAGLTTAQMMDINSFGSWNTANPNTISDVGGKGAVWRIYDGYTAPLLNSFLTPLTATANNATKTYDALAYTGGNGVNYNLNPNSHLLGTGNLIYGGTSQGALNAGNYSITPSGLYSDQQGYNISFVNGSLTINPALLSASISGNPSKVYDGNTTANLTPANFSLTGFVAGQGAGVTQTVGTYNSPDVLTANTVNANLATSNFLANTGTLLSNYILPTSAFGAGFITPLSLSSALSATIIGTPTKIYNGTTIATLNTENYSLKGFVAGQGATITQTVGTYNSPDVLTANTISANLAASNFLANTGTLLSNYILPTSASGAGFITPATLSGAIIGNPTKVYDGNTTASLIPANFSLTGFVAGQGASITQTVGTYNSPDVLTANTISANLAASNFLGNTGTLLSNYILPTSASGAGFITPATLSGAIVGNPTKVYDGNTTAILTPSNFSLTGFVAEQGASVTQTMGTYNSPYGVTANTVNANLTASNFLANPGTLLSNYTLPTSASGPGSISVPQQQINNNTSSLLSSATSNNARVVQTVFAEPINNTSTHSSAAVSDVSENFTGNVATTPTSTFFSSLLQTVGGKAQKANELYLPTLIVKNKVGRVKRILVSRNQQFVSLLLDDGSIRAWDLQRGVQRLVFDPHNSSAVNDFSAVNEKDESLVIATQSKIAPYDVNTSVTDSQFLIKESGVSHFATSSDGSLLLMNLGSNELSAWDSQQNNRLWQNVDLRGTITSLAISDNKDYGAVLSNQLGAYALPSDLQWAKLTDAVDIIDLKTGKTIKNLPNSGEQVVYMKFKDNETLRVGLADGIVFDWSIVSGNKKPVIAFDESVIALDESKGSYAYVAEDRGVRVVDNQGAIKFNVKNQETPFKDAKLLDQGKKLLTVMEGGELSLWDVPSGKKMLRLFSTPNGWTVMDASGRFDGSENAFENFSWLANNENIPLDSFSDNYYEPGLLTTVLQSQDAYINSSPNMVRSGINLPPQVTLKLAEQSAKTDSVTVQLDVFGRGGEIDKVNVYHNGRLLDTAGHIVSQQQLNTDDGEHRIIILNVKPSAGKNTVKVIASNTMGIENSSGEVSFEGKDKTNASLVRVVSVGIDKYRDSKLDLDYSVADAGAIQNSLEKSSASVMGKNIYNERATKQQILDELKTLSKGVQEDVLVIYFAGHGIAVGKEWYFLPYETQIQPDLIKVITAGISATELGDIFKNSEIQHIMLMVDACYSGAAMDAFRKSENSQRYFTRKLSRNLGITVVAAAAKDQEAFELKNLGHGLFTYLVTKDLQEKAGVEAVSAHGLADNIVKTLPALAKTMVGSSQEPVAYTRGDDFMITDLGKAPNKDSLLNNKAQVITPVK